jgi:hypothetical protein
MKATVHSVSEWRLQVVSEWRLQGVSEWKIYLMSEWRLQGVSVWRLQRMSIWRKQPMKCDKNVTGLTLYGIRLGSFVVLIISKRVAPSYFGFWHSV